MGTESQAQVVQLSAFLLWFFGFAVLCLDTEGYSSKTTEVWAELQMGSLGDWGRKCWSGVELRGRVWEPSQDLGKLWTDFNVSE